MEIGKELFKQANELRKKRKFAKEIHNRLIIFDARQNPSEFDTGSFLNHFDQIFSKARL